MDWAYWKWICIEDNYYNNNWDLKYFFSENIFKEIFTFWDIIYLENQKEMHNKIDWEIIQTWYIDIIVQKND